MRKSFAMALAVLTWPALAIAQPSGLVGCEENDIGLWSVAVGTDLSGVRSFYAGQVTLLALDTVEPACCAAGVAIVMPDAPHGDEPVGPRCWALTGYGEVDLRAARSRYDPRSGLTLTIPTSRYDAATGRAVAGEPIRLRINAARGTIVDLGARGR